ncbi:MAG: hypothetical protein J6L87_06675, partial [Clostridia bacterium]|nr:hypothetical protein [Clostridia bacterium]
RPKKTRKPPLLSGHTVTVSLGYQRYHFNEMLYLVQMITNAGGRYTLSSRDADTLYTYDCGEEGDSRLAVMEERREAGEEVEIYPIKMLFDLLETSEARLANKPRMDLSHLEPEAEEPITGTENEESDAEAAPVDDVAIDGFLDMSDDILPV